MKCTFAIPFYSCAPFYQTLVKQCLILFAVGDYVLYFWGGKVLFLEREVWMWVPFRRSSESIITIETWQLRDLLWCEEEIENVDVLLYALFIRRSWYCHYLSVQLKSNKSLMKVNISLAFYSKIIMLELFYFWLLFYESIFNLMENNLFWNKKTFLCMDAK